MADLLASSLDLFRRLPPQNTAANLALLLSIHPELADDLLSSVDQPLGIKTDASGRGYLTCDYNRDGDSFRSPWSNTYDPPLDDGTLPSDKLRELESKLGEAFEVYREMYYEGGLSSVYLWDVDEDFAGVVLVKKSNDSDDTESSWDSVHVFECSTRGRTAHYKLTSTVMLYMSKALQRSSKPSGLKAGKGEVTLGGSMTRQKESDGPFEAANATGSHISNLGKLIEDMEITMRNLLQEVYFSKTQEVVNLVRSRTGFLSEDAKRRAQMEMVDLLKQKHATESSSAS